MSRPERQLSPDRSALDRFGYELRKWRKARGLSQERAGALVHVSGALLQRIEIGERRPARDLAVRCDDSFRAGGALIEAWERFSETEAQRKLRELDADIRPTDADKSHDQIAAALLVPDMITVPPMILTGESMVEVMRRRAFLVGMATAASFGAVGSVTARETIRHEVGSSFANRYGVIDVEEWREVVAEYGETYPVTEPGELLKSLMVDLYGLHAVMEGNPGEHERRELRRVGAMLSAFTAQTIANLGNLREARRWWRTARQAADESEDPYTVLWIRGREIVRAGYERRPLSSILRLIDEAEARITGRTPVSDMPEYLSGKAQALAFAGGPGSHEAVATLNRLREAFGALPAPALTGTYSIFTWGEERLWFTESLTYTYLGDYRKADCAQQAALALYQEEDLRSPAQIELQRAICLIGSGDALTGVRHAQDVITELPGMHRIRPVADLGYKVLSAVPAKGKEDPTVREFEASLNAAFTVVPELTAS